MIDAMIEEIDARHNLLDVDTLDSIYFGGGTPSVLSHPELVALLRAVKRHYTYTDHTEITLEANPDDLDRDTLSIFKDAGVNRLSIGIQSFIDRDLTFMNRSHNAREAITALKEVKEAGFDDFSIDLIFGTPNLTDQEWTTNILKTLEYEPNHISCYNLTIEPKTVFHNWRKRGKIDDVNPDTSSRQFMIAKEKLEMEGYIHYEISNYARPQKEAIHNTNYWKNEPYLGIGPSAHSYDGTRRYWNISNNSLYMKSNKYNATHYESEELTIVDIYNEYIMTSLRTTWGCSLNKIKSYGSDIEAYFLKTIQPYIGKSQIIRTEDTFHLTKDGMLLADHISSGLFLTNAE